MTKQEGKIENNYKIEYFWGFKSNLITQPRTARISGLNS